MNDNPEFVITLSHHHDDEKKVTLAFTLGLASLEKGCTTAIILLLDGVHVGRLGCVDDIDLGEPFLPVKELLDIYLQKGGQLLICAPCWEQAHIPKGERIIGAVIISERMVVDLLMNARSTIQLN